MMYTTSVSLDTPIVTSAMDGQLLLAFYDGRHFVKVFDLADSCKLLHQVDISPEDVPIHKDNSILVSQNSVKDNVLFAYRSGKEAMVFSAKKGKVIAKLMAHEPVASVQGVAVTREYFLVICRYPCMKFHEILHLELFSVQNFGYVRTVKGCCYDFISILSVNRLGSHVVALCPSPDTNTTEIVTWNLETEDHKHLARFSSLATAGVCFDLQYCLAICDRESSLRVWNLASKINDQSLNITMNNVKRKDGVEEIITMKSYPRYAVCKNLSPGTVTVWNIVKSKCKGNAVRVERGLIETTDVVLVRDMKLYILSDKEVAAFTENSTPVFQTLLIYNLLRKKYVKKQTGLYIIPCPKYEYKVLEGDLLLGLSENRDHFVIWNLETGFIQSRIRPAYKDKLSLLNILPAHLMSKDSLYKELLSQKRKGKDKTAPLTPWERRNETKTARKRRLETEVKQEMEVLQQLANEKNNAIDQYLLSGDEKVIVCSYYAHHLVVFSLETLSHVHTLEDRTSMLFLHTAALMYNGSHIVLSNYDDSEKVSYVTLWDLQTGKVRKRLKNEPNVCCIAITDDADRVVFGVMEENRLKVWDPFRRGHKTIPGYGKLQLNVNSKIHMIERGEKAVLLAGEVSLWDLSICRVLSVFTPDSKIQCLSLALDESMILIGMSDNPALITLKLKSKEKAQVNFTGRDLFGEASSSSEEEDADNSTAQTT
nr:PREDICTED: uncharacterized protein LOC102364681 [Latimeria chalumnae]|eukprot:XP_014340238.1 PREDICTED: uncharacterized protein LOC102364681 [Latimeria chalumnae]